MLQILKGFENYSYLDKSTTKMLNKARHYYSLISKSEENLFKERTSLIWFTWTSTSINLTLYAILTYFLKLNVTLRDEGLTLKEITKEELKNKLSEINNNYPTALEMASIILLKRIEKYDIFFDE